MIFVDTSALVARYLSGDTWYQRAAPIWDQLEDQRVPLVISSLVMEETCTMVGRRAGHRFAANKMRLLYASKRVTILRPEEEDERKALYLFEKYGDQRVSFTDCTSFVLMRRHRIPKAFTFDRHFRIAGFDVLDR